MSSILFRTARSDRMVNNWTTAKDKQKYNKKHSKQKWKTENKTQNKETKQRSRMMSMKVSTRAGDNLHGIGTRGRRLRRHDRLGVRHDSQSLQNNDAIQLWRQHGSRKMHARVDTSRHVSSRLVWSGAWWESSSECVEGALWWCFWSAQLLTFSCFVKLLSTS